MGARYWLLDVGKWLDIQMTLARSRGTNGNEDMREKDGSHATYR